MSESVNRKGGGKVSQPKGYTEDGTFCKKGKNSSALLKQEKERCEN